MGSLGIIFMYRTAALAIDVAAIGLFILIIIDPYFPEGWNFRIII